MAILRFNDILEPIKPSVITIGMFDGVHIGHQKMIEELKQKAVILGYSSVLITFENHPKTILASKDNKNIELLQTNEERLKKLSSFNLDYIVTLPFTQKTAALSPKSFLDYIAPKLNPQILLLGYDNRFGNPNNNDFEDIISKGYYKDIKILQDKEGFYYKDIEVSSTKIRNAIKEGNILLANKMLKENYSLIGIVVKGLQNGRKLGFPTANIKIDKNKIIPKDGVYATKIFFDSSEYNGITNIGHNPTFNAKEKTIETYIFDFSKDIYQREITVEFIERMRDEMQFADKDCLKQQMLKDTLYAKKILL